MDDFQERKISSWGSSWIHCFPLFSVEQCFEKFEKLTRRTRCTLEWRCKTVKRNSRFYQAVFVPSRLNVDLDLQSSQADLSQKIDYVQFLSWSLHALGNSLEFPQLYLPGPSSIQERTFNNKNSQMDT
uniref:Uncharacterized protein n=1 Tax=Romanomermis culicivorax TaxID=13658 RepID=A0A915K7G7_ROMCU